MRGTVKQLISYMLELDDTKIYEVKEYKEKRNLDQNAKYWKLLNELALTLKIGVEELHYRLVHSNKKEWQPKLLEIQYKKYGYFSKEEVIKCKKYGKIA